MLDKITPDVTIDLQPPIFQLTLDTALFMIFGETAAKMQMSGENLSRRRELANAANTAQEYLAYRTRVGDFHWLINGPPMWRACKTVHSFVDAAVTEALNAKEERKDQIRRHTLCFHRCVNRADQGSPDSKRSVLDAHVCWSRLHGMLH